MRSFIITSLLFTAILSIIFFNRNYINSSAQYIVECVEDSTFEADPADSIERLEVFWEENQAKVGLSVGYKELDRMSDLIIDLRTYFELGNSAEVKRVRVLIVETADEISRLERFSLENLL